MILLRRRTPLCSCLIPRVVVSFLRLIVILSAAILRSIVASLQTNMVRRVLHCVHVLLIPIVVATVLLLVALTIALVVVIVWTARIVLVLAVAWIGLWFRLVVVSSRRLFAG